MSQIAVKEKKLQEYEMKLNQQAQQNSALQSEIQKKNMEYEGICRYWHYLSISNAIWASACEGRL